MSGCGKSGMQRLTLLFMAPQIIGKARTSGGYQQLQKSMKRFLDSLKTMTHISHLKRLLICILIGALIESAWTALMEITGLTGYEIHCFEAAILWICTSEAD
jgi:hypothetical protein